MSTLRDDLAALRRALDAADAAGDADASAIAELRSRCASVVASSAPSARAKISADEMSAEVVDSNPYSRLMALQRMGIVSEYRKIREKAVAVVGCEGL